MGGIELIGIMLFSIYIAFVVYMSFYLLRLKIPVSKEVTGGHIQISIMVSVRNEEKNIVPFVQHILNQSYSHFELIFIDDNSDDKTVEIIQKFNDERIRIFHQQENRFGKKEAIKTGLDIAKNEWIVFTDADAVPDKDWLWSYVQKIKEGKADFILAPLNLTTSKQRFFSLFQQMDFAAMQYISLAAANTGKPFMCNGANMAIKREIADGLYQNINTAIPSGDDVFLLHAFLKENKGRVDINLHRDSLVCTNAASTWKEFVHQRLRWASKAKLYTNPTAIFVSWLIYLTNLFLVIALILSCFYFPLGFFVFAAFWLVKMIFDFPIFYIGKRIIPLQTSWKFYFPLISFIYFLYISGIGMLSLFMSYKWKKRNY